MESIKYEITEKDIRDYLDNHSKDELIRFREALFVKYIKHHDIFSKEKIEMLLDKSTNHIDGAVLGDCCSMLVLKYPFYSFKDFLENEKVDISAYMHILIPTLGFYKKNIDDIILTNGSIEKYLPSDISEYDCGKLTDVLENYIIAGKINGDIEDITHISDINMSKTECNQELTSYMKIYGVDTVDKVKKLVSEG